MDVKGEQGNENMLSANEGWCCSLPECGPECGAPDSFIQRTLLVSDLSGFHNMVCLLCHGLFLSFRLSSEEQFRSAIVDKILQMNE